MKDFVRINGIGNAWPVLIGTNHPFYNRHHYRNLSNSSFSIIRATSSLFNKQVIEHEVLIDAGITSVHYILQNHNRIPDAVFLTHAHPDHSAGLDWIIQSSCRLTGRKDYPVYATRLCFEHLLKTYPYLSQLTDFRELLPAVETSVPEWKGLKVVCWPVFHSQSSPGSSMLMFATPSGKKTVFTGDILCPLLRRKDFEKLTGCHYLFTDCSNRFPYPKAGHWSFSKHQNEKILTGWLTNNSIDDIIQPHLKEVTNAEIIRYFEEIRQEYNDVHELPVTIMDFYRIIKPQHLCPVHYSGTEDKIYYQEKQLTRKELTKWCFSEMKKQNTAGKIILPYQGMKLEC